MPLDQEWEKFSGGPNIAYADRLHVTINKSGIILINANCHRLLGRPEAVQLYFNRKKDSLALKPAHPRLTDAFPLKAKSGCFLVHASPFCQNFGISVSATEKFVYPEIDDEGILRLDLSKTITVKHRHKRKPRS